MSAKQVVKVTPKLMTELGVVPVLVSMDASMVTHRQEFDPVSSWKLHVSFRFLMLFVHFAIYMHLFVHHCTSIAYMVYYKINCDFNFKFESLILHCF